LWSLTLCIICSTGESAVPRAGDVDNVPEIELQALQDLYNTTNGAEWEFGQNFGNPWNFSGDPNPCLDYWEGVTCTSEPLGGFLHVEVLYLPSYHLVGSIPNSIANLTQLVNLSLAYNFLSGGGLPNAVCNLTQLRVLQVGLSFLQGTIPSCIGSLTNLVNLQLDENAITGTVPVSICDLVLLELLFANDCLLQGSLPSCFGALTQMRYISMQYNYLTGTLPIGLENMTNMTVLDISNNHFRSTLPAGFSALTGMQQLMLYQNAFSGPCLDYLVNMVNMTYMDVSLNAFTGTIPSRIGALQQLGTMSLDGCRFSGTLPPSLSHLYQITRLTIGSNFLTGTIPAGLFTLQSLKTLSTVGNALTGPIPPTLEHCQTLVLLALSHNHLTGLIPNAVQSLTSLKTILLVDNQLSGSIPVSLLSLPLLAISLGTNQLTGQIPLVSNADNSGLFYLDIGDNLLTGPFPDMFEGPTILGFLNLSSNLLTGTLPASSIGNMHAVNFLYLESNLFSGALPDVWVELYGLSYLFLNDNIFTSTIPDSLGAAPFLYSVNMSQNFLSGPIPQSLSGLSNLSVLLLQQNLLTGSLDGVFDPVSQRNITTVQVSDNQLTGTLPEELSQLVALQVFAAVSNCFTGSIPVSLCGSASLVTLALDGLQSATSCQRRLFPAALEGTVVASSLYSIRSPLSGGVPSCLFGMGNLTTLHLSGNGLTGGLPDELTISDTLTDLSLSHNKLSGSIPSAILEHSWTNLDLSYNRFGGSLRSGHFPAAVTNASLYLNKNRLSGRIPAALVQMQNVDILESNLFSCQEDRSDLPQDDPDEHKYACASDALDEGMYAWLSAVVIGLVVIAAVRYGGGQLHEWRRAAEAQVKLWWCAAAAERSPHCRDVCLSVAAILHVAVTCCVYSLMVLLPMYAVCSSMYGTYAHQYAWAVSAAYLSGSAAFAWEFVCLALLAICAVAATVAALSSLTPPGKAGDNDTAALTRSIDAEGWKPYMVYAVAIATNVVVVIGVNTGYVIIVLNKSSQAVALAQIALAVFKVAFNGVCSPMLVRRLTQYVLGRHPDAVGFVTVQLFVSVVNNILVPCLVVSIINPDCFYNIFKTAADVVAHFEYGGRCLVYEPFSRALYACDVQEVLIAQTSYSPPFDYSYQCSSSFITYYSPAYVNMCIIAGIALPLAQLLLQWLHGRAVRGTRWFAVLDAVLPRILKPVPEISDAANSISSPYLPYFDASQHLITLLTYLALLLTFGAVFPPLAVCFAVTMLCMAAYTRLKVGRFLFNAQAQGLAGCAAAVEQECSGVGGTALLRRSVGMVVAFSCLFYTLFLFDTLGDAEGLAGAYWVLIVVPLLVMLGVLAVRYISHCTVSDSELPGEKESVSSAVELPTMSPLAPDGVDC
jgi:Leucine-rich repeat (LRR) protein